MRERAIPRDRAFNSSREEAAYIFFMPLSAFDFIMLLSAFIAVCDESVESDIAAAGAAIAAASAGLVSSAFGAQAANTNRDATIARRFIRNTSPRGVCAATRESFASCARAGRLKVPFPSVNTAPSSKSLLCNGLGLRND